MTPTFEYEGGCHLVDPYEYNLIQTFGYYPNRRCAEYLTDLTAFGHTSLLERPLQDATLAGFVSVFVTTALHEFSAYGTPIRHLTTQDPLTPPPFARVARTYRLFTNPSAKAESRAFIYAYAITLLDKHVGGIPPPTVFAYRSSNEVTFIFVTFSRPDCFGTVRTNGRRSHTTPHSLPPQDTPFFVLILALLRYFLSGVLALTAKTFVFPPPHLELPPPLQEGGPSQEDNQFQLIVFPKCDQVPSFFNPTK